MIRSFHLVADPGHSWLKVPVAELQRLGIESNISSHSYFLLHENDYGPTNGKSTNTRRYAGHE